MNLFTVGFIWMDRAGKKKENDFKKVNELLTERLDLTKDQQKRIFEIRKDFFNKEAEIDLNMRPLRDTMNMLMFAEQADTIHLNVLARRIADYHFAIEQLRMEQANQFKLVCNQQQRSKFNKIVFDIRDYFKKEKR
jgi:Spy/CpxP family protein refolding chaperone